MLTAIIAPPGFGKTTLAAQWARELAGTGIHVAWLSVDTDDNELVWFLSHLVQSIRQVRPALARELDAALDEHGDNAVEYMLATLINDVQKSTEPMILIIDDWHRISHPPPPSQR